MAKRNLVTSTKRDEVARVLEKAILTGVLRPGTRLQEMKLASEMKVSQSCIREALRELEGFGLVIKYSNRGSFVMNLTNQDLLRIYQVRRQLEPLACALAAPQLREDEVESLQDCLREMHANAKNGDYRAYVDADFRFHRLIWESQPNRHLEKSLKAICLQLFAGDLVRRRSTCTYNFSRGVKQHQLILNALKTGDSNLSARIVQRILDRFLRQDVSDYYKLPKVADEAGQDEEDPFAALRDSFSSESPPVPV